MKHESRGAQAAEERVAWSLDEDAKYRRPERVKMGGTVPCPAGRKPGAKTGNQRKRCEMTSRVKTTATLLAAILMAMAGVMPVLAYDQEATIPLTVEVLELFELRITVSGDGTFSSVSQGSSTSLDAPLVLTVESPTAVTVEAELRSIVEPYPVITSGLFYDHMMVQVDELGETTFADFTISHPIGETVYNIDATINVPSDYSVGTETATLVFWITS